MEKVNSSFKSFIFIVRLKFQKWNPAHAGRSVLKFLSRIPTLSGHCGGYNTPKFALGFIPVIFLAAFLVFSCFKPHLPNANAEEMGIYHLVKKNETVWSIAKAYGISVQELVRINNITDINSIKEDSVLFIPSAIQVLDTLKDVNNDAGVKSEENSSDRFKKVEPGKKIEEKSSIGIKPSKKEDIQEAAANIEQKSSDKKNEPQLKPSTHENKIGAGRNRFIWPVRGDIKVHFGIQPNKTFNNWIKIVSAAGGKIKAAESGTVIFSSKLPVFSETIIIRHKDKFSTVYTHLKKRLVKIDKNVKKGEAIAILGEKDDTGEVYMNFEIRLKGKAHDPLLFLP